MDDLYRHFGDSSLWETYDVSWSPNLEVTEVWIDDHSSHSPALVENRSVSATDIDSWLEESSSRSFPAGPCTRSTRIVWVGRDSETARLSPSANALQRLTNAWKLEDGLNYARSSFAGVSALTPQRDTRVFTVAYHPKLAAAWSYTASCSHVIIFAEGEERAEIRRILKSKWSGASARHAMFPSLWCSLMLAHGLDKTLEDIKAAVREVEARTGHHRFASRHQTQPAAGELGHLSAQMSGCAAKLANGTRKMKVVEAINGFIHQHAASHDSGRPTTPSINFGTEQKGLYATTVHESFSALHMELLDQRVQMQAVDTAYVQQRVQIQIAALFHLIAQQDNAIAFDTARATRSIAASSLEDSSSMKMLALVAMFFLPGSFVAALFSTPLFAWEDALASSGISVDPKPQFALFWAVTAPLTALVFVLYGLWMWVQKRRERQKRHRTMSFQLETED